MRLCRLAIVCFVSYAAVAITVAQTAQNAPPSSKGRPDVGPALEVARSLSGDKKHVVEIPSASGKVKQKIDEKGPKYPLPFGESGAVVFKLAEYSKPYTMIVRSLCNCVGFKKSVLVLTGVFVDQDIRLTHTIDEADLETHQAGRSPMWIGTSLDVTDDWKADRYLLVYTRADVIGKTADKLRGPELGGLLFGGALNVSRADHGTIEIEVKPLTVKK